MSSSVITSHYIAMTYKFFGNTYPMKSSMVFYLTYSRMSLHVHLCRPESARVTSGGSR